MYAKSYAQPLFRSIVSTLNAMANCRKSGNNEWLRDDDAYKCLDAMARREAGLPVYSFYPLVFK